MDGDSEPIMAATGDGAEVIDLDGVRVQRGLARRPWLSRCKHHRLVYCTDERRVWCEDCQRTIENFDAFMVLADNFQRMEAAAHRKLELADEAMRYSLIRRATKAVDRAWLGGWAVACPHCRAGILAEDYADGLGMQTARDYEMARRARQKEE